MPKYHVHVYPVVRVLVPDIEADSQAEACQKAEAAWDWSAALRNPQVVNFNSPLNRLNLRYADKIDSFLVDEDGDAEHQRSTVYDAEYRPEGVPVAERRVVVVFIEGGVASNVEQPDDVDVHIIDFDTEGAVDRELCTCERAFSPHFHAEYPGEPGRR